MLLSVITPKTRQVLAASSFGMLLTGMMTTWGFPSAALPQMDLPDSDIHFTPDEASWFATVPLLMCIPGSLIGASVYEWAGPRRTMLVLTPLLCFFTMTMAIAKWSVVQEAGLAEIILMTSRVGQGSIVALLNPLISLCTYEISDQHLRGTMTSLIEVWATMGFLLCYISGCFLSWMTMTWLLPLITLVPAFIGIFFSPESPLWLARKGREEEAKAVLTLLRCTTEEVMSDLKTVKNNIEDQDVTCSESLQKVAKKSNVSAMIVSSLILVMKELSGFAVLSIYVVYIFNEAGVGMDPRWSSVVVGLARLICNGFASFMLHRIPRKLILIGGNMLTMIATLAIGTFFYLQSRGDNIESLSWLPLIGFVVHMIGYAGAVGPCTWTVAVEVLPGPVRAIGFGIGSMSYAITAFAISKLFMDLQEGIGLHGVFWMFSAGCLAYIILVVFCVPETKGRSLQDIQDYWENPTKTNKSQVYV